MKEENRELFELCKEVYEKFPEWKPKSNARFEWYTDISGHVQVNQVSGSEYMPPSEHIVPLYTSDYLLERLPGQFGNRGSSSVQCLRLCKSNEGYMAGYIGVDLVWWLESVADTPLKALLKLTLKLHEEEIL